MDRQQLTLTIAAALFAAIVLGWILRWIFDLLNPAPPPEPVADSEWAEYAKACEVEKEAAQAQLAEVENDLGRRLTQTQAELEAAMDGLGAARREAHELQAKLDDLTSA